MSTQPSRDTEISCQTASELMPWFLNGSLDEKEQLQVEAHLADCRSCCGQLEEAVAVWEMTDSHIPSFALAEYALGLEPSELDRQSIESHLATCSACREELDLVSQDNVVDFPVAPTPAPADRSIPETARVVTFRLPSPAAVRRLAVAASFTAIAVAASFVARMPSSEVPTRLASQAPATVAPASVEPSDLSSLVFADGFENGGAWAMAEGMISPERLVAN